MTKQELRKQIEDLLFNIGYGIGDDHPAEAMVDGMHSGYSEYAASQILALTEHYSNQREVEAVSEALETVLQDVEHTTECNCCANGGGEHDLAAHIRVIERYKAAPQPLSREQKEN